jgi:hypothetical protein
MLKDDAVVQDAEDLDLAIDARTRRPLDDFGEVLLCHEAEGVDAIALSAAQRFIGREITASVR